jgi:hypothetical protein
MPEMPTSQIMAAKPRVLATFIATQGPQHVTPTEPGGDRLIAL